MKPVFRLKELLDHHQRKGDDQPVAIKQLLIIMLILSLSEVCSASELSDNFLKYNKSIRSSSLGDATCSYPDGTDGIYYNPAGLSSEKFKYSNENHDYKNKISDQNSSQAFVIGKLGYSEDIINSGTVHLNVKSFGLGINGKENSCWGIKYKDIDYRIDNQPGKGYSIDFGLLLVPSEKMIFGFLAKDVFKDNVPVPSSFCAGLTLLSFTEGLAILTELEYFKTYNKLVYKTGVEFELSDTLILRAGYRDKKYALGGTFVLPFVQFEYAVITGKARDSETIHQLGIYLGK